MEVHLTDYRKNQMQFLQHMYLYDEYDRTLYGSHHSIRENLSGQHHRSEHVH